MRQNGSGNTNASKKAPRCANKRQQCKPFRTASVKIFGHAGQKSDIRKPDHGDKDREYNHDANRGHRVCVPHTIGHFGKWRTLGTIGVGQSGIKKQETEHSQNAQACAEQIDTGETQPRNAQEHARKRRADHSIAVHRDLGECYRVWYEFGADDVDSEGHARGNQGGEGHGLSRRYDDEHPELRDFKHLSKTQSGITHRKECRRHDQDLPLWHPVG